MDTTIHIEGKEINAFVSLEIVQAFNVHHSFELVIKQDILIGQAHTIHSTQEYIGKFISIGFGEGRNEVNFFKGIITESILRQEQGAWGNLVLKGFSPTYLLESGNHFASFSEKSLKNIATELCKNLASNDLNLLINPLFKEDILYCCQYNESNFDFLNRLAVEFGEWFYYDGLNLFFGKPSTADTVKLVYGEHLESISFSLKLTPHKITNYSYHAESDEVYDAFPGTVRGDFYQDNVVKVTDKLYRFGVTQNVGLPVSSQSDLDRYAKNQQGQKVSKSVQLSAKGDNPHVQIGCKVELLVKETDLAGEETTDEAHFLVTSITHKLTGTGGYTHSFEAISSKTEHIPAAVKQIYAENQVGTVKENKDPSGFGRVKVQMPWQKAQGETTDWIRVLTPDAGSSSDVAKNRGFVFVPEVGDQVILGFEHNHPSRPFVLGSVFHGKNGAGGGKENNVKTIKTRSGHMISLDDTKGSENITISDRKNNVITLDTASGSITISALDNISITAKNIDLNAKENISFTAGADISTSAKENITQSAGDSLSQQAGKDATLAAKNISVQAQEKASQNAKELDISAKEVKINSTGKDMLLASGKKVNLQSGEKIKLF